jgi:hypothetical protein
LKIINARIQTHFNAPDSSRFPLAITALIARLSVAARICTLRLTARRIGTH